MSDVDGSSNAGWSEDATRFVSERMKMGQVYLGAVDGHGVLELVFTLPPDCQYNLITIGGDGIHVGSVQGPEAYVRRASEV